MKFISTRLTSSNFSFPSAVLTFEYCSLTSDHGWIMFLLILSRGIFFLFPEECVLKAHAPAHVNKNKELSNEWKQHLRAAQISVTFL